MLPWFAGLPKRQNKGLIRSLYLTLVEDFDSTMHRAKDYLIADEALDYEEKEFPNKQQKRVREKNHLTSNFEYEDHLPGLLNAIPCLTASGPMF